MLLRRLSLSRSCWNHKVLLFTDNQSALGALMKGRSSRYPMLRISRQVSAISLAFGIRLIARDIASERNYSDWPSRGGPVGVAPETLVAHADRL